MGAAACLIKYLDLLADENLFGKFKLRELALDGHMKLDRAATKALNLFPQVHARTHARTSARAHTHTLTHTHTHTNATTTTQNPASVVHRCSPAEIRRVPR